MEQIINTRKRVLDPEFLLEYPLGLFGPQRADTIRFGGFSQEPFFERCFFRHWQVRGPTGLSLGHNCCEAVIPIPVHPPLHKSSAAAQGPGDRGGIVTFDGHGESLDSDLVVWHPVAGDSPDAVASDPQGDEARLASDRSSCFYKSMSDA